MVSSTATTFFFPASENIPMEVSGAVFGQVPRFSGAGTRFSYDLSRPRMFCGVSDSGFSDKGHLHYYYEGPRCGDGRKKEKGVVTTKKKMKLMKGLSKDLSMFSVLGFGLDPDGGLVDEVQGKIISEATEVLLNQLQQLRAGQKELNRRRKQEKAELKATRMTTMIDGESSESESSDSECEEVIDMRHRSDKALDQPMLNELQQLKAEQKEMKKKKKQEKAELKAARMKTMLDSKSSSSESSDSKCGEVFDMSCLRGKALDQPILNELQPVAQEAAILMLPSLPTQEGNMTKENGLEDSSVQNYVGKGNRCNETSNFNGGSRSVGCNDGSSSVTGASVKRIEVCMGNKCKKSGAAGLLDEFQRAMDVEGAVVGCKCMGKCRDGPNVRVLNGAAGIEGEGLNDSVRTPANPLCIGVGLEDVGVIVANFFGDELKDLAQPSAAA